MVAKQAQKLPFSAAILWISSAWLLAFALCFVVRSSYGIGAAAIALAGLIGMLSGRIALPLAAATRTWCYVLCAYAVLMLLILWALDEPARAFERIIRYLLAIPMVWALWTWRPSQRFYAFSLCVGIISAFAVVFYARIVQGLPIGSGYGYQNQISYSAIMMVMATAAAMASFAYPRLSQAWWGLHICALLGLIGALLTGGRGGLLVIFPTFICYLVATERQYRVQTVIYTILAMLLLALGIYLTPQLGIAERLAGIWVDLQQFALGNSHSSQGARLEMWQCSSHLLAQHTWFGTGDSLQHLMSQAAEQGHCHAAVSGFNHVHNDFLDIFVRYGLIGGAATLLMYFYPAYRYLHHLCFYPKNPNPINQQSWLNAWAGLAVCLAFYTCSMSNANLAHNITSVFFLLFNAWFITGIDRAAR